MNFNIRGLLEAAADLMSEDGSNFEYDRAIVELTANLLGVGSEESRDAVRHLIESAR